MRPRFLLFGDSITEESFYPGGGWGASLATRYARKADVVLRGFSGYNTRWALFLLHKIFPGESEDPPLLVTIFFGANDAAIPDGPCKQQHVPIPEYKSNLLKIISHIKGISKETHIILITPPPVHEEAIKAAFPSPEDTSSRKNEVTGMYANACKEIAREAGVAVIDLWLSMQQTQGWETKYLSDGLHLSPDGNAFLHNKLIQVVCDEGLSFEAMQWDFPEHSNVNAEDPAKSFS